MPRWCDSVPGHPKDDKSGSKPSCCRGVYGVAFGAQREPCTLCNPAIMHGEGSELRPSFHQHFQEWAHLSSSNMSRTTQYLDDANKFVVSLFPMSGNPGQRRCSTNYGRDTGNTTRSFHRKNHCGGDFAGPSDASQSLRSQRLVAHGKPNGRHACREKTSR